MAPACQRGPILAVAVPKDAPADTTHTRCVMHDDNTTLVESIPEEPRPLDASPSGPVNIPAAGPKRPGRANHRLPDVIAANDLVLLAREQEFVIEDMAPTGSLIVVAGAPKVAKKTWLMIFMGFVVSLGRQFLGKKTLPMHVYYAFLEDGAVRVASRLSLLGLSERVDFTCLFSIDALHKVIATTKEAGTPIALVIDCLVVLEAAKKVRDENSAVQVEELLSELREFAHSTGSLVFLVHHFRKQGDTARGSSAIQGSVDGWWSITPSSDDGIDIEWTLRDAEGGRIGVAIDFKGEAISFTPRDATEARNDPTAGYEEKVRSFFRGRSGSPVSQAAVAKALNTNRGVLRPVLDRLEKAGEVCRPNGAKGGYAAGPSLVAATTEVFTF